jgi:hypothetical protein
MLPFFRKIRYRLAKDNQFFKYSRYAIGEIVLVVVGILIALYINNWNEERKEREKFDQLLIEVHDELVTNIKRGREVIDYYYYKDSIIQVFYFDSLKISDTYREIITQGIELFEIKRGAYDKLKNHSEIASSEQDSVIAGLKDLYTEQSYPIMRINDKMLSYMYSNIEYMEKFPWYSEMVVEDKYSDEAIDFFRYDPTYKNQVANFAVYGTNDHRGYIETFERNAVYAYSKISKYLNSKSLMISNTHLFDYKASDYEYLVGTYLEQWRSSGERVIDSTVISIENDKLYYTPYRSNGSNTKREMIPVTRFYFRTFYGYGYYPVYYDEKGYVKGIGFSDGTFFYRSMKVQ